MAQPYSTDEQLILAANLYFTDGLPQAQIDLWRTGPMAIAHDVRRAMTTADSDLGRISAGLRELNNPFMKAMRLETAQ